ncbi:ABC transporter ATP-binding protein [Glaciecola sp. MH2013]|uniref:ABC transporter ATP-binding protein n=1 Tax=Glaciecola sp. MH2013 TaxID=2785524 RepID=UPI00189FD831|nr:ABC transporter ATP-binding protein [Glaciecola sp. MH2013]MBF7071932.1 ABC transporter ATP-binding protein [Glaciecola sp. MH2013]
MKTLLSIALATSVFASSVSATNVQLRPADSTFETQVCFTAATEGLEAARTMVKNSGENFARFTSTLSCNGYSLERAARIFSQKTTPVTPEKITKVKFITDEATESKVCRDAVLIGVDAALEKHDLSSPNIICNGRTIESFIKRFEGRTVAL